MPRNSVFAVGFSELNAVIGCGYWGKNLVRNFAELGILHTICDVDPQNLKSLKSLCPWVNTD